MSLLDHKLKFKSKDTKVNFPNCQLSKPRGRRIATVSFSGSQKAEHATRQLGA